MSLSAVHSSKRAKRLCQECRDRAARFRYRGTVRADRDHTLCFECFRSERDRRRAQLLAAAPVGRPVRSPFGQPALTPAQLELRGRMLRHLLQGR